MKKPICFIALLAVIFAVLMLASCGKSEDSVPRVSNIPEEKEAEIPYASDFTCEYYSGERFADLAERNTFFGREDEILIKLSFTLSAEAFKDGKRRLTIKPILPEGFYGSIVSANTSSVNNEDLTAAYDVDDTKSKKCEIEIKAKFYYSNGKLQIGYVYDEDELQTTGSYNLLCAKSFKFTYNETTDGYFIGRDSIDSKWIEELETTSLIDSFAGKLITGIDEFLFQDCVNLTSVEIPDSVTEIREYAFLDCTNLQNVKMPKTATSIGLGAFNNCNSLQSITIPDGVMSIDRYLFYCCSNLKSVEIPNSITSIGESAFYGCKNLMNIDIFDSSTSYIGNYAFSGCNNLTSIIMPNSVTSIGKEAFNNCSSLISVIIPDGVTSIGEWAFGGCISITSITIPDSVTNIGSGAFNICRSLTSITIPDGVTSIGDSMFNGCSSLISISMPDTVTFIGEFAFGGCDSLTSVTISENVTSIGYKAFSQCTNLSSVTIPENASYFGLSVFSSCNSLTDIVYEGTMEEWNEINSRAWMTSANGMVTVKCIDGEIKVSLLQ